MRQKHLSIRIDQEQKEALERLARRQETTVGALVRRAIVNLLGRPPGPRTRPRVRPGETVGRDREIRWLAEHRSELEHLRGEYVIIQDDELVAHGPDLKEVLLQARQRGVTTPFVDRVPDGEPPDFWMGL